MLQFDEADIVCIPAFNYQYFRTKHPDVPKDEENTVITTELSKMIVGMRALCREDRPSVLMAHYTVTGANLESSQAVFYTNLEPIITRDSLEAAGYTLGALGHVHRPQEVFPGVFYSGAINTIKFSDEGQKRGFWLHEIKETELIGSEFVVTPYRKMLTLELSDTDIEKLNAGESEAVADDLWRQDDLVKDKIVRIRFTCSDAGYKAFSEKLLREKLNADGAFYVWSIERVKAPDKLAEEHELDKYDPSEALDRYLKSLELPEKDIAEAKVRGEKIIAEVESHLNTVRSNGVLVPLRIEVENYRTYQKESFDFTQVKFCAINGANGVGKSSLFMDAIIDCLYGDSREGKNSATEGTGVPWLRADEGVRSGSIAFTFKLGDKLYRVLRKAARSGGGSLTLSEFINDEWVKSSSEKKVETQKRIIELLGMDAPTFKTVALIMQDQYGLFLEADNDKRADILGNILGLGVYSQMEKAAEALRAERSSTKISLQTLIDNNESKISGYGDVEAGLSATERELEASMATLKEVESDKETAAIKLRTAEEAEDRISITLKECNDFEKELLSKGSEIATLEDTVKSLKAYLADKNDIEDKERRYAEAKDRMEALRDKYLEYIGIEKDIQSLVGNRDKVEKEIVEDEKKLSENEACLSEYDVLLEKAEKDKEELTALQGAYDEFLIQRDKKAEYEPLTRDIKLAESRLEGVLDKKRYALDALKDEEKRLGNEAALLESSDCLDIEKANCRFIKKALASKETLKMMSTKYADIERAFEADIRSAEEEVAVGRKKLESLDYSEARYMELRTKADEYELLKSSYESKLAKINGREARLEVIAMIKASLEKKREELRGFENHLGDIYDREKELKVSYTVYCDSESVAKDLEEAHEKALVIPAKEESLKSAEGRIKALGDEIGGLERRINDRKAAVERERSRVGDIEKLRSSYEALSEVYDRVKAESERLLREKGGYEELLRSVEELRSNNKELYLKRNEVAYEQSLYEILRKAFGRDGIPHLIIGDVVPVLKYKANSILAEMTDGAMSIDIKLERCMKSDKSRLREALDIFIDDKGKTLPYKSKSGGEKVRASLSVIIALAELKARAADIRTGFLFIDEAPFLDSEGVQAYVDALVKIRERYPDMIIMAITHDPVFKDRFSESVTIYKDDNGSHVIKD